jgi:hypothetical protein
MRKEVGALVELARRRGDMQLDEGTSVELNAAITYLGPSYHGLYEGLT